MTEVYIALGSNLGDRRKNLENAIDSLSFEMADLRVSGFYETEAEEMEDGHSFPFMNAVVSGFTELSPFELIRFLMKTENELGRVRNEEKGHYSRKIDLDLLIYGDIISKDKELELPHPRMHKRIFVLKPLMDLNPNLKIPGMNKTVGKLHQEFLSTEG